MTNETKEDDVGNGKVSAPVRKDYTGDLPMYDLEEALKLASMIHTKGLETAPMSMVAKETGYKSPSSTPFYLRMVASRLFGLIASRGPEVTTRTMDCIKPDSEEGKRNALIAAVLGIKFYAEIKEANQGKRLNPQLIANGISKKFHITDPCALLCARVFIASMKFAGMLSDDSVVLGVASSVPASGGDADDKSKPEETQVKTIMGVNPEDQQHTLFLDKGKERKIVVSGPITITRMEYERLCKWLEVAMIVEEKSEVQ